MNKKFMYQVDKNKKKKLFRRMLHKTVIFVTFYVFMGVNIINTVFWNALV